MQQRNLFMYFINKKMIIGCKNLRKINQNYISITWIIYIFIQIFIKIVNHNKYLAIMRPHPTTIILGGCLGIHECEVGHAALVIYFKYKPTSRWFSKKCRHCTPNAWFLNINETKTLSESQTILSWLDIGVSETPPKYH